MSVGGFFPFRPLLDEIVKALYFEAKLGRDVERGENHPKGSSIGD